MKKWHLTLTRATHSRTLTLNSPKGQKVTLHRGKVTITDIDLGTALLSPMVRVIRVEGEDTPAVEPQASVDVAVAVEAPAPVVEPEPEPEPAKPVAKKRATRKRATKKRATKSTSGSK